MKKTLIALAALAAAGATLAQSSVTIYGRLDLGMNQITTTEGAAAGVDAFSLAGAQDRSTGSRLGFRGTEDLGGGLRAGFQYEIGINADRDAPGNANTRLAQASEEQLMDWMGRILTASSLSELFGAAGQGDLS